MKKIFILFTLITCVLQAQVLTSTGVSSVESKVNFSQKDIYGKISKFAKDVLIHENVKIIDENPGNSLVLQGTADNKACFDGLAQRTCFQLQYSLLITALNNAYRIEVLNLKAHSDKYPDADYTAWFDETGQPIPNLQSCINGTSEYFQSINKDILEYIESGDYW